MITLAVLLIAGFAPGTSQATITFTQNPVMTQTNLGDFLQVSPNSVDATGLNNFQNVPLANITTFADNVIPFTTPAPVGIQSPQGGGQAFLFASDPTIPFGGITVVPINPPLQGFSILEFNPQFTSGANVTFTLVATSNEGQTFTSQPFTANTQGNANNRTAAVASNGEFITKLQVEVVPPSADFLRQFRIDGVVVPEPSTTACACTVALFGLGLAWRRRSHMA